MKNIERLINQANDFGYKGPCTLKVNCDGDKFEASIVDKDGVVILYPPNYLFAACSYGDTAENAVANLDREIKLTFVFD